MGVFWEGLGVVNLSLKCFKKSWHLCTCVLVSYYESYLLPGGQKDDMAHILLLEGSIVSLSLIGFNIM